MRYFRVYEWIWSIYFVASAVCQSSGDPHYTTWDGGHYSYQGICLYLLAGQCGKTMPKDLEPFAVK